MPENNSTKTCAIIVSHNRPVLLKESIESVRRQSTPCDILIIDNNSEPTTREVIVAAQATDPNTHAVFLSKNVGGAGGFHRGLKHAWRLGYDSFWLMDDDTVASHDALQKLLVAREAVCSSTGRDPAFVCSNVRWLDGTACKMNVPVLAASWLDHAQAGAPYLPVRYASFVSLLVSRKIVKEYGLPLEEYFIWFDDSEYTYRISKDANGIIALDSLVLHKTINNVHNNIKFATEENLWKYEFGVRNKSSFIIRNFGFGKYLKNLRKTALEIFRSNLKWKIKQKILRATAMGITFSPEVKYITNQIDQPPPRI